MKSDNVKKGMQQAPHRSLFNALGFTKEEVCWAAMPNGITPTNANNIILLRFLFITQKTKHLSI